MRAVQPSDIRQSDKIYGLVNHVTAFSMRRIDAMSHRMRVSATIANRFAYNRVGGVPDRIEMRPETTHA